MNSDIRLGTATDINAVNGGVANFGSLGLRTAGSASVIESSATHFNGVDVGADLSLQSQDLVTQSGVDVGNLAGTRYIIVGDDTVLRVVMCWLIVNESVLLLRASSDPAAALANPLIDERGPVALNNGEVMNNSFNDAFTVEV